MKFLGRTLCLLLLAITLAVAAPPAKFVLDFQQSGPLPSWLALNEGSSSESFSSQVLTITPPTGLDGELALTFYFNEQGGGFLRVFWQNDQGAVTLCDNLYEGVGMPNQKTLIVPNDLLGSPGQLTLQASYASLGVRRIEFSWVKAKPLLQEADADSPALLRGNGDLLGQNEIDGAPAIPVGDQWKGQVISAPLTEKPERIDGGVDFVCTLEAVPSEARLKVKALGAPLDKDLVVWINGVAISQLGLQIPNLTDAGYLLSPDGASSYIGWRDATVYVPARYLRPGENQIKFDWLTQDAASASLPVAVKDLTLQLRYPPSAAASAPAAGTSFRPPSAPAPNIAPFENP